MAVTSNDPELKFQRFAILNFGQAFVIKEVI